MSAPREDVRTPEGGTTDGGERLRVALTWLVVAIPALWGVAQVVEKALALFR